MKVRFLLFALRLLSFAPSSAYYLGLKSFDNTVANLQQIESQHGIKLPVVSFIFDPRKQQDVPGTIAQMAEQLGRERVYHLTVSPNQFTAQQVAEGAFDAEYLQVFQMIREKKLKVIFRTMHEMNGGRYPWSSSPSAFKQARIHVRNLSRTAGLDQQDILFDFSVNHWDMPTTAPIPSQKAPLIPCSLDRTGCYRFEDYYPGDQYVDLVGFSFYNRGKATSSRLRLSPEQILLSPRRKTLARLQNFHKPLIIDEVGTTTVRYEGAYSSQKSRETYLAETQRKEERLAQLQSFLLQHPEILLAVYFNVDYTAGLQVPLRGEADRAVLDFQNNRNYQTFFSLYQYSQQDLNPLASYFLNSQVLELGGKRFLAPKSLRKHLSSLNAMLEQKLAKSSADATATASGSKAALIRQLLSLGIQDHKIQQSLELLLALEPSS